MFLKAEGNCCQGISTIHTILYDTKMFVYSNKIYKFAIYLRVKVKHKYVLRPTQGSNIFSVLIFNCMKLIVYWISTNCL